MIRRALAWSARPVTSREAIAVLGVFLLAVVALAVWAAHQRGVWLDEIWTLWMSRPDLGLADAARLRWLQDTNPPFFYLASWASNPVTGLDIFARRLLNLFPVAIFAAGSVYVGARLEPARAFAGVLAVLVMGSTVFIPAFAEHRSYVSQLCFAGLLALALFVIQTEECDLDPRRHGGVAVLATLAILFSFNLNQVTALISGCVLTVAILSQVQARRWRWAVLLALCSVASSAVLILTTWAQAPYLRVVAPTFWIHMTTAEAAKVLAIAARNALAANLIALGAAVWALASAWRGGRGSSLGSASGVYVMGLGVALSVACVALIGLNTVKAVVVSHYLVSFAAFAGAAVAALAAETILARRWLFALVLVNALAVTVHEARLVAGQQNWDAAPAIIAAAEQACPTTLAYAISPPLLHTPDERGGEPPNAVAVHDWGYGYVAGRRGIRLILDHPSRISRLPLARACPTLLWSEHYQGPRDIARIARLSKFAQDAPTIARIRAIWTDRGFVLVLPPPVMPVS